MRKLLLPSLALALLLAGCGDETTTAPVAPPAAPRGLFSITGDHEVTLVWMVNTERDIVGYRVYSSPCAYGPDCDYVFLGATTAPAGAEYVQYVVSDLSNGVTRFYAVSAVNRAGMESELSRNDVFDTPRPAGTALALRNYLVYSSDVGYDFSAFARTNSTAPPADIFYGYVVDSTGYVHQQVFVPDYSTDIQDAGFATSLDALDYADTLGWSPTGTAEAIVGHNYLVWTRDNHYAKFRVTAVSPTQVVIDWAYQIDAGNRELLVARGPDDGLEPRRPIVWLRH